MNRNHYFLKVRYAETDSMGIVYHGSYLPWLELGRTRLIKQTGFSYKELEQSGIAIPVTELEMKYMTSAFYDDAIVIVTAIDEVSKLRFTFRYEVRRIQINTDEFNITEEQLNGALNDSELLAVAKTRHVLIGKDRKPLRMDRDQPELYQALLANAK